MSSYLNTVRRVAVLAAMTALAAGCDKYIQPDTSKPAILRVVATDVNSDTTLGPPVETPAQTADNPGNNVTMQVPANFSNIRVYFTKVVDGSTIQQPGGALCVPAANTTISVTAKDSAGTPDPNFQTASVCYDPAGPAILIQPATNVCGGPAPSGDYLHAGITYTIGGTVKDHQGNSLDFTVTITANPMTVAAASVTSSFDNGTTADLTAGAATDIPVGALDSTTNLYTTPTGSDADWSGLATYGTPVDFAFTSPIGNLDGDFPTSLGGTMGIDFTLPDPADSTKTVGVPSVIIGDLNVNGDEAATHLYPYYPLENGATYTVSLDNAKVGDEIGQTLGASGKTTYSFTTADTTPAISFASPAPSATGVYPTFDPILLGGYGAPAVSYAASTTLDPTALGTVTITPDPGATVTGDTSACSLFDFFYNADGSCFLPDGRNRTIAIGATNGANFGDLQLDNDTDYSVKVAGAKTKAGASIPDFTWSFHTVPWGIDPSLPGYVSLFDSIKLGGKRITGAPSHVLIEQKGNVPVITYTGKSADYWLLFPGKVAAGTTVVGPANQYPGMTYIAPSAGTVTLHKGGADGEVVAGNAGVGRLDVGGGTYLDMYQLDVFPDVALGVTPTDPLDFGTAYTLVVDGVTNGKGTATTAQLSFVTTPFKVMGVFTPWKTSGGRLKPLAATVTGAPAGTGSGAGSPFYVLFTGTTDTSVLCPGGNADPAYISLLQSTGNGVVPVDMTCTALPGDIGVTVTPTTDFAYSSTYIFQVKRTITSKTGGGVAVAPATITMTTRSPSDLTQCP